MLVVKEILGTSSSRQAAAYNARGLPAGGHRHDDVTINPSAIYNLRYELECARDSFLKEALQKNIEFSLSFEKEVPVAFWDIASLRAHVLNTMLSNAIRYTPAGGKVAMVIRMQGNYRMIIQVSDSGPGLAASEVESIVCNDTDQDVKDYSHRGGLNLALKCIHAHKGVLSLANDSMSSGATFLISLPLYELCLQ